MKQEYIIYEKWFKKFLEHHDPFQVDNLLYRAFLAGTENPSLELYDVLKNLRDKLKQLEGILETRNEELRVLSETVSNQEYQLRKYAKLVDNIMSLEDAERLIVIKELEIERLKDVILKSVT